MANQLLDQSSAFAQRRRLYAYIQNGHLGQEILEELVPNGEPHQYERQLWDYKLELPTRLSSDRPSDAEKLAYNIKLAEIIKDAVSFYNSYGGYLVIGVRDHPREVVGFDKYFDCDDLNRRIRAATKHEVECHFVHLDCTVGVTKKKVGLLFIPQRPENKEPAQFLRDAPLTDQGKKAFKKFDIYFRQDDGCRPAEISEDYTFLCSQGQRQFLPPQDTGLELSSRQQSRPSRPQFYQVHR